MSSILSVQNLAKSYGSRTLFNALSFHVHSDDKIGVIGPNGAGKSSLIKILAEKEQADQGEILKRKGLKIGYASQSPEFPSTPIEEFLLGDSPSEELTLQAHSLLGQAEFLDFQQNAQTLSGGWKKRLDIVRALLQQPDLLLLDEPTNHLDLEGILWLERFLKRLTVPFMVISHDRYFLENTTNSILEINPCYEGGGFLCKDSFRRFFEKKEAFLAAEEKRIQGLKFKVREETNWLRTSPKARTGKSKARINQAYDLIDELSATTKRHKKETVKVDFSATERKTRKLLGAKNLSKTYGASPLFSAVDIELHAGSRLGIVGKNGTGKSTLLQILAGKIASDTGTLKYADDLKIVYFDQHREQLPLDLTLKEALSPNSDYVQYRGQQIHVNGWARRFLFSSDILHLPLSYLSGGERARILIAKLILEPADILFLDEPTNDLDIQTLEVIEEALLSFQGAVVMISHDRCLMDSICTSLIALGDDLEDRFFADYSQYAKAATQPAKTAATPPPVKTKKKQGAKLSYKEKKELETIDDAILAVEQQLEQLNEKTMQGASSQEHYKEMEEKHAELEALYARWQFLSDKAN